MIDKIKYRIKIIRMLLPFTRGVGRYFVYLAILSLVSTAAALLTPQLYKAFIDNVIIDGDISLLSIIIAGYVSVFTLNTAIAYIKNYCLNRFTNISLLLLRMRIFKTFFKIDFCEYDKKSTADMKIRIHEDTNYALAFANVQTIDYIISYVFIIVSAFLLVIINLPLALFSFTVIPATILLDHKISKKEKALLEIDRQNDQQMENWLYNSIQGWKEIKALTLEKYETRLFVKYMHIFSNFFGKWIYYWVIRVLIIPKIKNEFLFRFCLYFLGGLLIMKNNITIGSLLVFIQYYELLSSNITNVSKTDAELQSNMSFYDRLIESLKKASSNKKYKCNPQSTNDNIEFKNLWFRYANTDKDILKNISFNIAKGDRVAITGRSGEGKSTIAKLIMGMLAPSEGMVLFGSTNIEEMEPSLLYKKIGFVMQENTLFNVSIKQNLLLAKRNATDEEIDTVCKKAYIYDFIQSLPDKYETIIGERGIKLSGGQRQRLVLARLFLRDVDVLMLDEATSALDQYSENIIHEAIKGISDDKTIIIIAHRKSSIALCNRVFMLEGGTLEGI